MSFMPLYLLQHLVKGLNTGAAAHWMQIRGQCQGAHQPAGLDLVSTHRPFFCGIGSFTTAILSAGRVGVGDRPRGQTIST